VDSSQIRRSPRF